MDTEIGILYNFHVTKYYSNIDLFQPLKKMQNHLQLVDHTRQARAGFDPRYFHRVENTITVTSAPYALVMLKHQHRHLHHHCQKLHGAAFGDQVLARRSAGTAQPLFPVCMKSTKTSSLIAATAITTGLGSVNAMNGIC